MTQSSSLFQLFRRKHRRRGLLTFTAEGDGLLNRGEKYEITAEVTEVDRIGERSKLRVDRVYGVEGSLRGQAKQRVEGWQPTTAVTWRAE